MASASSSKIVINILNLLTPKKSSRQLTADLLWKSGGGADLINGKKKVPGNYHSKPLRSKSVVDINDDFEVDFQEFKYYSDDEVEIYVKPFAFSTSKKKNSSLRGSKSIKSIESDEDVENSTKRNRKNQYREIR
ncbi:Ethylene-responsive transcription factor RAP2-12 [Abeliophyllum distichum]|uniref:Ethylene-responsive transcription factor RAP2-12 n=1 Tax=Abeliophyllum distichum TaxID=126358 RepID=A0ABD1V8W7_9LAMI